MDISEEWIASLTRFETDLIKTYLDTDKKQIDPSVPEIGRLLETGTCIHCGSKKIIRYGHSAKGRQRYLCKDCNKSFTIVSKSFFKNAMISYEQWLKLMECEMAVLTLKETAYQTGLSVTFCFYLRHKIYEAFEQAKAEKLQGEVQLDTSFLNIGLKDTKVMLKPVKGSKKNPKADILFDKDPKICISTAADSSGGILFLISGYGGRILRQVSAPHRSL